MWKPIATAPENVEILVTDGKGNITTAHYFTYGEGRYWRSHSFSGYEWEWSWQVELSTLWMGLDELPKIPVDNSAPAV